MIKKVRDLSAALEKAQDAANSIVLEDGGTANLDTVMIKLPWWTEVDAKEAAGVSGVGLGKKETNLGMWRGWRSVNIETGGMASLNTKRCEAAMNTLKNLGYEVMVRYITD